MATRKERLETELVASDKASKPIEAVADAAERLDGTTADVGIDADDRASDEVKKIVDRISALTRDEKVVILNAEKRKLDSQVKAALVTLGKVDGETAEAVLDAKNNASRKIDLIADELSTLDASSADVAIEATDRASGDLGRVEGRVQELDRMTPRVDVEVAADGIDGILEKLGTGPAGLGGIARGLASPTGAIAAIAGALVLAGSHAADLATEAGTMASLFDTSPELVSGIAAVLRSTADVEASDLTDIVLQMAQALQDSPEHAATLGVTLDEVRRSPMEAFVKAIDNIARDGVFSFDEMQAASVAFGEEGVRQVAAVVAAVGPEGLSGAIDALPDSLLITPDEVRRAREFKTEMSDLMTTLGGISQDVAGPVLEILNPILSVLGEAAGLIPTITQPLRDLISGESLRSADFSDEFLQFVNMIGRGVEQAEAWQLAFGNMDGFDMFVAKVESANALVGRGVPLNEAMAETFGAEGEAALALATAIGLVEDATGEQEDATDDATRSVDDQIAALERQRDILVEATEKIDDYVGAQRSAYDTEVAYREARQATTEALSDYQEKSQAYRDSITADYETTTEAVAAQEKAERERRDAGEDLIDTIVSEADEYVTLRRAAVEAAGGVYTGQQSVEDFNNSIASTAGTIPDELIPQLIDMVMRINDIPANKRTEVEAAIRSGDPLTIETTLNNLSRTRTAQVNATKNAAAIAGIESDLNHLARTRNAAINLQYRRPTGHIPGTPYPVASGIQLEPGNRVLRVGEQGVEEIELPRGTRVHSNAQTRLRERDRAGNGPAVVNNITNLYPAGLVPRGVRNADRSYDRRQGPS